MSNDVTYSYDCDQGEVIEFCLTWDVSLFEFVDYTGVMTSVTSWLSLADLCAFLALKKRNENRQFIILYLFVVIGEKCLLGCFSLFFVVLIKKVKLYVKNEQCSGYFLYIM